MRTIVEWTVRSPSICISYCVAVLFLCTPRTGFIVLQFLFVRCVASHWSSRISRIFANPTLLENRFLFEFVLSEICYNYVYYQLLCIERLMINCVWCLLWCLVISQGWCAFPELCSNSDVGAHYGDQSTLPGYEMWPPSVDSSAGGTDIQKWYKVGLDDCNKFLAINKAKYLATETPRPFVAPTAIRGSQSLCRGNEMLYKLTGAITWIFGPGISQATEGSSNYTCPVGHNCWFGVLTCDGSLTSGSKHSEIKHNYIRDTSEYLLNYNRWKQKQFPGLVDKDYPTEDRHGFLYYHNASYGTNSLSPRALHMNMRIAGDEVVTPYVRYTTMPILHDTGTASGDGTKLVSRSPMVSLVDVLIANYTLTIPSTIRAVIEAKILWFYPGKLFNFPAPNHPSESHKFTGKADTGIPTSLYGENWDRMGSIFMGGSEYRCKTNGGCKVPNDCCGCDDRTRVPNSPVLVNIPVLNSASVASTGHGGDSNSDSNSDSKSGSSSSNVCGNSTDLSLPLCLNGNHYGRWLRLPSELRELCHQRLDSRNVQIKFSGIANTAVKGSDARRRGLYRELMRYTDGSNICTLMDVSVSAMSLPTDDIDQLMLYAPYSCRYSIYSAEQVSCCPLRSGLFVMIMLSYIC